MEKEIAWTTVAQNDFWEIVSYLKIKLASTSVEPLRKSVVPKNRSFKKATEYWF